MRTITRSHTVNLCRIQTYLQRLGECSVQLLLSVIELSREVSRVRVGFPPGFDAVSEALAWKVLAQAILVYFAVPGKFRLLLVRLIGRHLENRRGRAFSRDTLQGPRTRVWRGNEHMIKRTIC